MPTRQKYNIFHGTEGAVEARLTTNKALPTDNPFRNSKK
jgi:hypothetical protein